MMTNDNETPDIDTTWGNPATEIDYLRQKQLKGVYGRAAFVGEVVAALLICVIAASSIAMTFTANYENIIFDDGSGLTCELNGKTGALRNGNK